MAFTDKEEVAGNTTVLATIVSRSRAKAAGVVFVGHVSNNGNGERVPFVKRTFPESRRPVWKESNGRNENEGKTQILLTYKKVYGSVRLIRARLTIGSTTDDDDDDDEITFLSFDRFADVYSDVWLKLKTRMPTIRQNNEIPSVLKLFFLKRLLL